MFRVGQYHFMRETFNIMFFNSDFMKLWEINFDIIGSGVFEIYIHTSKCMHSVAVNTIKHFSGRGDTGPSLATFNLNLLGLLGLLGLPHQDVSASSTTYSQFRD